MDGFTCELGLFHGLSLLVFALQLLGYVALSTALEWRWYHRRLGEEKSWKIQPEAGGGSRERDEGGGCGYDWGLPFLDLLRGTSATSSSDTTTSGEGELLRGCADDEGDVGDGAKKARRVGGGAGSGEGDGADDAIEDVDDEDADGRGGSNGSKNTRRRGRRVRHPKHALYATINLVVSALFAGAVTELSLRGLSQLHGGGGGGGGDTTVAEIAVALGKTIAWQSVWEYYWHRLMHYPPLYRLLHKLHHHYKSPQPWDDLFIHPLEAFGYYVILYSPAFCVGAVPVQSFLIYVALLGTFGVLDHCGVDLVVLSPAVYNTRFHDLHHKLTRVNYAFPFPAMDVVHGTFRSESDEKYQYDMRSKRVSEE